MWTNATTSATSRTSTSGPLASATIPNNPYCKWVNTEGVAFELARTDWHYVFNTFCFGYGVGYKFSSSAQGSANGNFLGLGADSCQRAVVVEQAQPPGLLISNGEFVGRWSSTDAVCLDIGPKVEGKVSLVNCSFWGPIDRCVWMQSAAGQFTASACHFVHWDNRGVGSPAIQLDAGKAIVQGCTFAQEGLNVQVGSNVVSAILTANQAAGGFRVDNQAGKRTQSALNEEDAIAWTREALAHYQVGIGGRGRRTLPPGMARQGRGQRTLPLVGAASRGCSCRWFRASPTRSRLRSKFQTRPSRRKPAFIWTARGSRRCKRGNVMTASLPPCPGDQSPAGTARRRLGAAAGDSRLQRSAHPGHPGVPGHHAQRLGRHEDLQRQHRDLARAGDTEALMATPRGAVSPSDDRSGFAPSRGCC